MKSISYLLQEAKDTVLYVVALSYRGNDDQAVVETFQFSTEDVNAIKDNLMKINPEKYEEYTTDFDIVEAWLIGNGYRNYQWSKKPIEIKKNTSIDATVKKG